MGELALYRKYRSHDFADVVGQAHVTKTLVNALGSGRISHAYLFTGPRGVGKTSVARLIAKAVNCSGETKPCNKCDFCTTPLGSDMDIIEIDAASNRRIDEMRDLREKVNLAPSRGKYKVYIIDEVHMLTTEAFNALLKTLEEPPSHVIFVLATTEAHKVPATIISRTQRFNFAPITSLDTVSRLAHIAGKEKIKISDDALKLIATSARGGLRDAISLLDQAASTVGEAIEVEHIRSLLGWSHQTQLDELCQAIASKKPAEALKALDTMIHDGAQVGQITLQLLERWRQVLLAAVGAQKESDELTKTLASSLDTHQIAHLIKSLTEASASTLPQIALERVLIEAALGNVVAVPAAQPQAVDLPKATSASATPAPIKSQPAPQTEEPVDGDLWSKVMVLIKSQNNSLYALMRSCGVELSQDKATLTARFNFHRDRLQEPKNRQLVETILAKVYGHPMKLVCQLEDHKPVGVTANTGSELVSSALEILGGEVVDG
jgi:DNA polymerase III subunit gamma/tau